MARVMCSSQEGPESCPKFEEFLLYLTRPSLHEVIKATVSPEVLWHGEETKETVDEKKENNSVGSIRAG